MSKTKRENAETAAEGVVEEINQHEMSGTSVARAVTREFWSTIVECLRVQIAALDEDERAGR